MNSSEAPAQQAPEAAGTASEELAPATTNLAVLVASGILLSRIAGLIRESVFAHFFGNSDAADAFKAAFRIPNILQNLFGEGVLSASFIPVYSKLLGAGEEDSAAEVAWMVGAILTLAMALLVAIGVGCTPYLIDAIAPGFVGAKRDLTITLVRILFPGAGLLVISAWCLGILNSHHRFFASYTAPVAWNLAIIAALLIYGPGRGQERLAIIIAWASVVGALLQILVQIPQTLLSAGRLRLGLARCAEPLRAVGRNFLPVVGGRGVVQMSAYVDNLLASLLPTGAVAALNYAQILYILPVSLFGMSVAAAELPTMSRAGAGATDVAEVLRGRLDSGLRQIAFLVVPSAAAFLVLGDVVVAGLFQSGSFSRADAVYVWSVLAGSAVGLLAVTMGRLYASAFYALWDTRTPFYFALIRVALTTVLGYLFAITLPSRIGIDARWGVAGLTLSAGLAGWVEFALLRGALNRRVGWTGIRRRFLAHLWLLALLAAGCALAVHRETAGLNPRLEAILVLPIYGAIYLGLAWLTGIAELERIRRRLIPRAAR